MNYDKLLTLLAVQNDPIALKNKLTIELQDTDMDATILLTTLPTLPDAITGLLALCEGSMESRLVIAFSIMDNDDDGFVSKRQMWRILRSILCVTHLLVERPQTVHDCQSIMQTVDTAAVQMVYDLHGNKSHVTSSEVQLWYLQQGYKTLDLELANLFDRIESPQKGQFKGNFDFDFDHLPQVHPDHPVEPINIIFKGVFQTGREFILTSQDSLHIRNIVLLSTIYSMDFLEVIHLLHCLKSTHGLIHRKSLCEFVYALMDIHIVGREEIAATIASLIFGDSSDESVLPFPVVAAGLSVLCSGSKSSKLNLGIYAYIHVHMHV
jgi:Ca2+-binding EF-hand superfamily protein